MARIGEGRQAALNSSFPHSERSRLVSGPAAWLADEYDRAADTVALVEPFAVLQEASSALVALSLRVSPMLPPVEREALDLELRSVAAMVAEGLFSLAYG